MSTVVRGDKDATLLAVKEALDDYERSFARSEASLFRANAGSVRVRIVDPRFEGMTRSRRHDGVWSFLAQRLNEDQLAEVGQLLLFPSSELRSSLSNLEFENPTVSRS